MKNALAKRAPEQVHATEQTRGTDWDVPPVDIYENFDEIVLVASLPGVLQEDIDVTFEQGELRILGRVRAPEHAPGEMLLREFAPAGYQRIFQIGQSVDSAKIRAELQNGVLTLHLPKADAAKPRSIPVKGR
jgi:HSP20 family molecular chaperone IbpA